MSRVRNHRGSRMDQTSRTESVNESELSAQRFRLGPYPVQVGPTSHLATEVERLNSLTWQHFSVTRLSPTIGAELAGIDLTDELSVEAVEEIAAALAAYKVIFFRDQPLTAEQHVKFAQRFGDLEIHPFIPSNTTQPELVRFQKSAEAAGYENAWHHDVTWRATPSASAVLHAIAVPDLGGDTLFCDMYAAYEGLPADLKAQIETLDLEHTFVHTFGPFLSEDQMAKMLALYPPPVHPLVCTHDVTGRRYLYVNRNFSSHVVGMAPEESQALIDLLCRQADYPEYQCRFRWQPDSVAFWDNRAVQHYASSDYWPQIRVMERASIVGAAPHR